MRGKCWLLLLIATVCTINLTKAKKCKTGEENDASSAVALRVFESLLTIPSPLSVAAFWVPLLWIPLDVAGSVEESIRCHLQNYHKERLWNKAKLFRDEIAQARTLRELERIRHDMEDSDMVGELVVDSNDLKSAVYPVLPFWANLHITLYKALIGLGGSKYNYKHDEFVEFYAKLILRYWRHYRMDVVRENYGTPGAMVDWLSIYVSPAEILLKDWDDLAVTSRSKRNIRNLLDSCKLKKGSAIMLAVLNGSENKWESCWGSGRKCKWRSCPAGAVPTFQTGSQYDYHYKCRGETFHIYANTSPIRMGTKVHIQYSSSNGRGYWLSFRNYSDRHSKRTRTCPGRTFTGIIRGCDMETFTMERFHPSYHNDVRYSTTVHDQNAILLKGQRYVVFIEHAETNNHRRVMKPRFEYFD